MFFLLGFTARPMPTPTVRRIYGVGVRTEDERALMTASLGPEGRPKKAKVMTSDKQIAASPFRSVATNRRPPGYALQLR